jgi:hypothetical protein
VKLLPSSPACSLRRLFPGKVLNVDEETWFTPAVTPAAGPALGCCLAPPFTLQAAVGALPPLPLTCLTRCSPGSDASNGAPGGLPEARAFHSAAVVGSRMYVFGGHVLSFDAEANKKRRCAGALKPQGSHTGAHTLRQESPLPCLTTAAWPCARKAMRGWHPQPFRPTRTPRKAATPRPYSNSHSHRRFFNDLWVLDVDTWSWSRLDAGPWPGSVPGSLPEAPPRRDMCSLTRAGEASLLLVRPGRGAAPPACLPGSGGWGTGAATAGYH